MRFRLAQAQYADRVLVKHKASLANMSKEDLIKAIRQQGKCNGMGAWEVDALIEIFERRKSLRKAYHILLEYAGLEKDIHKLMSKRSSYFQKLLDCLTTGNTESNFELPHIVSKVAEYSLKSWVSVCRWRQLQWSPRPIPVPCRFPPTKSHFLFEFQRDIGVLLGKARESRISMTDAGVDSLHLIIVLITAAAEAVDDPSLLSELLKSVAEPANEDMPPGGTTGSRHPLLEPFDELISVLQVLSKEEVTAASTWQAFLSLKGADTQPGVFPVLRMNYGSVLPPVVGSSTFPDAYKRACGVLLTFFYAHFAQEGGGRLGEGPEMDRHEVILRDLLSVSGFQESRSSPAAMDDVDAGARGGGGSVTSLSMYTHVNDTAVKDAMRRTRPSSSPNARGEFKRKGPTSPRYAVSRARSSGDMYARAPSPTPSPLPPLEEHAVRRLGRGESPSSLDAGSYIDDGFPGAESNSTYFIPVSNHTSPRQVDTAMAPSPDAAHIKRRAGGSDVVDLSQRVKTKKRLGRGRATSAGTYFDSDRESPSSSSTRIIDTHLRVGLRSSSGSPVGGVGVLISDSDSTYSLMDVILERKCIRLGGRRGNCYKLIVVAFTSTCSAIVQETIQVGDELVEVGGYDVVGQSTSTVGGIIAAYQRGEIVPMHSMSTPKSSRRLMDATCGKVAAGAKAIPVRLCRHYDGWEELHDLLTQYTLPTGRIDRTGSGASLSFDEEDEEAMQPINTERAVSPLASPFAKRGQGDSKTEPTLLQEYTRVINSLKEQIAVLEVELKKANQEQFLTVKEKVLQKYDELHEMQETFLEEKLRLKLAAAGSASDSSSSKGVEDRGSAITKRGAAEASGRLSEVRKSLRAQSLLNVTQKQAVGDDENSTRGSFSTGSRHRSASEDSAASIGSEDDDDEATTSSGCAKPSQIVAKANSKAASRKASELHAIDEKNSTTGRISPSSNPSASQQRNSSSGRRGSERPVVPPRISPSQGARGDMQSMSRQVRSSGRTTSVRVALPGDSNPRIPTRHVGTVSSAGPKELATASSCGPQKKRRTYMKSGVMRQTELKRALQKVDVRNRHRSLRARAALKILEWWRLLYPRKKLLRRLEVRDMCHELMYEFLDLALARGLRSIRQRFHMMRHGAVVKIQTRFRYWKATHLNSYVRIQRAVRRYLARRTVLYLVRVVRAACRIGRFLYRRKIRLRHVVGKKILYRRVIRGVLEIIGLGVRDRKQKELKLVAPIVPSRMLATSVSSSKLLSSRRHDIYLQRLAACIMIQGLFRIRHARARLEMMRREREQRRQVIFTMYCIRLKRKIHYRRHIKKCAMTLQRVWRGACFRWRLMLQVLAGIKINTSWRKYRQYWKLKRCLRRIEIPVQIVLHGIRDIPANLVLSKTMKVRVSVWWTGLLHLVDQDDFMTVIQSKQPNIVRTTKLYDVTEMAISQNDSSVTPPPVLTPTASPAASPARRMSMVQKAHLLRQKEGPEPEKSASEKLVEFAKLHGQQGAPIRLSGHGRKETRPDAPDLIEEGSHEGSGDDKCDDSSSQSSDDMEEPSDPIFQSENSTTARKDAIATRISMDSVGRDSIHSLGSNLLSADNSADNSGVLAPKLSILKATSHLFSMSSAEMAGVFDRRHRNSLAPARPEKHASIDKGGVFGGLSNVMTLSSALEAFKAPKDLFNHLTSGDSAPHHPKHAASVKYSVNLDDEDLYIPGCHGNSVIRFDFYDGK